MTLIGSRHLLAVYRVGRRRVPGPQESTESAQWSGREREAALAVVSVDEAEPVHRQTLFMQGIEQASDRLDPVQQLCQVRAERLTFGHRACKGPLCGLPRPTVARVHLANFVTVVRSHAKRSVTEAAVIEPGKTRSVARARVTELHEPAARFRRVREAGGAVIQSLRPWWGPTRRCRLGRFGTLCREHPPDVS